jgi:hypothetical protein
MNTGKWQALIHVLPPGPGLVIAGVSLDFIW